VRYNYTILLQSERFLCVIWRCTAREVIFMFLYLVQHGEAKKENEDPARGLTEKGTADVRKTARFLQNKNLSLSRVFHSNKTRAIQTARIFADHLNPTKGVSEAENLSPQDDPEIWARRIAGMQEDIMLVGHLPYLAKLAGFLLCGDQGKTIIEFKMGGVVRLKRSDEGRWSLEWMVVPELLG
jgi:phosphohistidine phosphatase